MEGFHSEEENTETETEALGSSSTVENSREQQNSSQQEQPQDSSNAGNENTGDATSYEKLGIITARPKRIEYAVYTTRFNSFNEWPKNHHMKPEDLAKAGFFYKGYSDCVRCFYCGGGLRNWEPGEDGWVEHARWFPKCVFLLFKLGEDFINAVQVLSKERDIISYNDVIRRLQDSGVLTPLEKEKRAIARDPAVLTVVDNGYDKDQIIELAQEIGHSGKLSSDKLYGAAMARNFPKKECSNSVNIGKGRNEKRDKKTTETLRNEGSELRMQTNCKIYMDRMAAVVFLPCGHLVSCMTISCETIACPVCGVDIEGIVPACARGY